MTNSILREREPWLIAIAVIAVTLMRSSFPDRIDLGSFLAVGALALLLQGLVRDLNYLVRRRRASDAGSNEELACICLESAVGLPLILAGVALTATNASATLSLPHWMWPFVAAIVWSFGYFVREIVMTWRPWGFRRVANHGTLLVQWRHR